MIPRTKSLCSIFAVLALMTAQILGVARGYWCECIGAPTLAASAECVPSECHPQMAHGDNCCPNDNGSTKDSDMPEDDSHVHKILKNEARFQTFASVSVPAPNMVPVSYAGLPPITWLELIPLKSPDARPVWDVWRCPLPMAERVVRTHVLLV